MTAKLEECTSEELCVVIRFLWSKDMQEAKIYGRFLTQYENGVQPKRSM